MRKHLRIARPGGSGTTLTVIVMGAGNSLGTYAAVEYFGLKAISTTGIEEVPTAVPTAIDTVYSDGLSAGLLNGNLVWVASRIYLDTTDNGTPDTSFQDKFISVPEDVSVICYQSHQVPITGGGGTTATVYLPGLV